MSRVRSNERTEQRQRYDRVVKCDRCGAKTDERYTGANVFEVEIEATKGSRWPEGSFTQEQAVDCCEDCWLIVVEALEAAGFTFHVYDGQWFDGDDKWPGELPANQWGP